MQRAKSREHRVESKKLRALRSMLSALSSLSLFICGCSAISPPADYYQQVLEVEEHGEQVRRDTGRRPGEVVEPVEDLEPITAAKSSAYQLTPEQPEETSVTEQAEVQEKTEESTRREVVRESSLSPEPSPEPIAIASDVVKNALTLADLEISVRTVELLNGRLSGGRNSVRVNFLCESVDAIDDKFVAICAVIYHLDAKTNTVDVIVGIAEDEQTNLLAILQSDMSDVAAWINNELSRAEWFSKVIKKIL